MMGPAAGSSMLPVWPRFVAAAGIVALPVVWWLLTKRAPKESGAGNDATVKFGTSNMPEDIMMDADGVGAGGIGWTMDLTPGLDNDPTYEGVSYGPSPEQVTHFLTEDSYSIPVNNAISGITRYDGANLRCKRPHMNAYTHGSFPTPCEYGAANYGAALEEDVNTMLEMSVHTRWMALGVFGGFVGPHTSEVLRWALLPSVRRCFRDFFIGDEAGTRTQEVALAMTQGFMSLDNTIVGGPLEAIVDPAMSMADKIATLQPAWSGASALLSIYDPSMQVVHIAHVGSTRAVLGRKRVGSRIYASSSEPRVDGSTMGPGSGPEAGMARSPWEAVALTKDHTPANPEEMAHVYGLHPGEEDSLVENGLILGSLVSRAFGGSRWKWPEMLQDEIFTRFGGSTPIGRLEYDFGSPPYLLDRPATNAVTLNRTEPCFIILATGGLWNYLSSQQAVDLVEMWLRGRVEAGGTSSNGNGIGNGNSNGHSNGNGNINGNSNGNSNDPESLLDLIDPETSRFKADQATVQDDNVAVHLIRNALGGSNERLLAARLAIESPFAYVLDITVQVIFFNMEASDLGPRVNIMDIDAVCQPMGCGAGAPGGFFQAGPL